MSPMGDMDATRGVMPLLDEQERAALVAADHELSHLQRALEAAARNRVIDDDVVERLHSTARDVVERVNSRLPPHVDPDARDEIRRRLIELLVLHPEPGVGPLDLADRALVEAEAVRHVVRDLLQEQPPVNVRQAREVVAALEDALPDLRVEDLAELVGLSARQLQRRRSDEGPSSPRMQLVLQLVTILQHAWTDRGVRAWFDRPRRELAGQKPIDLLDDPKWERELIFAARSGRVQGGI